MTEGEKVAQQLRDAVALLESMAGYVAMDIDERFVLPPITITIEIGSADELPTISMKKDYFARKRPA